MYVAICDDENEYIKALENFLLILQQTYTGLKWKAFKCAEDVRKFYQRNGNRFDILITDIELGKMSGIDLANAVRERDRNVIIFYLTSYTEYALQCFRAEPLNFWVKPLSFDIIRDDFKRAYERILRSQKYITITENRKATDVKYDDIVYFETWGKKTLVHTTIRDYKTNRSLAEFQKELDPDCFVRVSQTYIINFAYIKSFSDDSIELNNAVGRMPIGRTYSNDFKRGLMRYKRERLLGK